MPHATVIKFIDIKTTLFFLLYTGISHQQQCLFAYFSLQESSSDRLKTLARGNSRVTTGDEAGNKYCVLHPVLRAVIFSLLVPRKKDSQYSQFWCRLQSNNKKRNIIAESLGMTYLFGTSAFIPAFQNGKKRKSRKNERRN